MKNTNIETVIPSRNTRLLTLSIFAVVSMLIFGLALGVNAATLTRQLEVGSRGQDVSDLQTFLAQDNSIYPQGLVTGYFGFLTKAAVSNFQSRNGISAVGRVGPITLAAINAQMGSGNVMGSDIYSPAISSLNVSTTNSSATFSWNTNENSSAIVYYSTSALSLTEGSPTTGVTIGGSSYLVHTDLRTSHTGTLMSLSPNTTYHYVIYVRDGAGNEAITWPASLRTSN